MELTGKIIAVLPERGGVSKNGNWAKIKYDGKTLYCNTAYLSESEPTDETGSTPVTPAPVG